MSQPEGVLREVAWSEVFPWLLLVRTFRIAISLPVLTLATLGVLLLPLGWWAAEAVFLGQERVHQDPALLQLTEMNRRWVLDRADPPTAGAAALGSKIRQRAIPQLGTRWRLLQGVRPDWAVRLYLAAGLLWTLLLWALLGGAISRIATVQLARRHRVSLPQAVRFAARHWADHILAPLSPLLFALLLAAIVWLLFGLLMLSNLGTLVAALLWPLAVVLGLGISVVLLGVLAGWPLMWPAISAEQRGDSFEAWSRSYSYVFQRPVNYAFYALVAAIIGWLGWIVVAGITEAVNALSLQAAFAMLSANRETEIVSAWPVLLGTSDASGLLRTAVTVLAFWVGLVRTIAAGYAWSFFWCAAAGVYLLLRRDVDQAELDEVLLEEEEDRYGLPPLTRDKAGVPEVAAGQGAASSDAGVGTSGDG